MQNYPACIPHTRVIVMFTNDLLSVLCVPIVNSNKYVTMSRS